MRLNASIVNNCHKHSQELLERSERSLTGGVSSPFRRKFPQTLFFEDGWGVTLQDVDNNKYLDYVLAWGPLILGHKHPALVEALSRAIERPHNYGAQHELEFLVAEQMCRLIPCAERVAFTSSGSEAVQLTMRLARAFTGRSIILKFEGHYHGWMDSTLLSYHPSIKQMGSAQSPAVVLGSEGQVPNAVDNVMILPWNDAEAVRDLFAARGAEIAAVITEPVLCNSGCLTPVPGFLAELRRVTQEYGAILIFDEVITGFRIAVGGAQSSLGVTPDIATFGKAIAAGLPLSAVCGRREIMELMVDGRVSFGGTFNGNCLSLTAADVAMRELARDGGSALDEANRLGSELMNGIEEAGRGRGIPLRTTGFGAAFSIHFTERAQLKSYRDTLDDNPAMLLQWLSEALKEGIYLLPDGRLYLSVMHSPGEIDRTLGAFRRILQKCVG